MVDILENYRRPSFGSHWILHRDLDNPEVLRLVSALAGQHGERLVLAPATVAGEETLIIALGHVGPGGVALIPVARLLTAAEATRVTLT